MSNQGGTMLFFLKAWKLKLTPRIHLCTVKTVKKTMFGPDISLTFLVGTPEKVKAAGIV